MSRNQQNQYPTKERLVAHPEDVQFSDGVIGQGYRRPGDQIALGFGSRTKYATNLFEADLAWVRIDNGNRIGIGGGYAIDHGRNLAYHLPAEDFVVTINGPLAIPGVPEAGNVQSLLLNKGEGPIDQSCDQAKVPSPFPALQATVNAMNNIQA